MGFIEETGAAQHYRDARITSIYEGTNGIQSIDLVTRKLAANGGESVWALLGELTEIVIRVEIRRSAPRVPNCAKLCCRSIAPARWLLERVTSAPNEALGGSHAYLRPVRCDARRLHAGQRSARGARSRRRRRRPERYVTLARFFAPKIFRYRRARWSAR